MLKTLWQDKKLLVLSNFYFWHNVFLVVCCRGVRKCLNVGKGLYRTKQKFKFQHKHTNLYSSWLMYTTLHAEMVKAKYWNKSNQLHCKFNLDFYIYIYILHVYTYTGREVPNISRGHIHFGLTRDTILHVI